MSATVYNPSVIFTGQLASARVKGGVITAKCVPGGLVFERKLPRFLVQPGCNHDLYSTGCGIGRDAYRFDAVVTDPGAVGYPFEFSLGSLSRTFGGDLPVAAHWFAGGYAEFGVGAARQRIAILRSSPVSSGAVTITLSKDPSPFPAVGATVRLWPGCDGSWATCQSKFGNRENFGGHPFMPTANPSLVKLSNTAAGGKK